MHDVFEPVLVQLTHYGTDEHGVIGQTPKGLPFSYSINGLGDGEASDAKGMYAISLPFTAEAHLLGIPKKSKALIDSNKIPYTMEPVRLEGNYNEFFTVFTDKNEQSEARYLLDPSTMELSMNFLKNFHWEIAHNTLYFYDDDGLPDLTVIDDFINELSPSTVESPVLKLAVIASKEQLLPITSTLLCPLCNTSLQRGKNWLACTNGHGYLMTASQLIETRLDSASFMKQLSQALGRAPKFYTEISPIDHKELTCPNCQNIMTAQPYQTTKIIIDTCRNCPYRWLDGNELNDILGAYRHE